MKVSLCSMNLKFHRCSNSHNICFNHHLQNIQKNLGFHSKNILNCLRNQLKSPQLRITRSKESRTSFTPTTVFHSQTVVGVKINCLLMNTTFVRYKAGSPQLEAKRTLKSPLRPCTSERSFGAFQYLCAVQILLPSLFKNWNHSKILYFWIYWVIRLDTSTTPLCTNQLLNKQTEKKKKSGLHHHHLNSYVKNILLLQKKYFLQYL